MDDTALVGEGHVGACQDVVGDGLAEDFDAQGVGEDFFGFALQVRVHDCDVVVAADDVAERGQALFYPLDFDAVWERVAEVLQFLVCCCRGDEEALAVTLQRGGDVLANVLGSECAVRVDLVVVVVLTQLLTDRQSVSPRWWHGRWE